MAVSMRDVAVLAGVSTRTVSNVVSGYVHVRPETRERVQRAIDELRFKPNVSARSLRLGRTGMIGLALPEIAAPYFAELADHIERAAHGRGLTLLIDQTAADGDRERQVLRGYGRQVIDGLIFSPMAMSGQDLAQEPLDIPTVLLGERAKGAGLVRVAIDDVAAAREATGHLLDTGRRRVLAVGADLTPRTSGPAVGRLRGYHDAHAQRGLVVDPELEVRTGGFGRAAGYTGVDRLLRAGTRFDAMFCFNDVLAFGAIRAATDHGVKIPEEVGVVGWDDIEEAAYSTPSLSSVRPDKATIASTAVERLLSQIAGEPVDAPEVLCDYWLMLRESSTGPMTAAGPVAPGAAGAGRH
jgi:DNA-binding LacI/PurR family transcriptional regulator